jgi:hypothetical protein
MTIEYDDLVLERASQYVVLLMDGKTMPPTRKEHRTSAVVPVRITAVNEQGESMGCLAHTLNVSRRGALMAGVTIPIRNGMVIRIIRGRANASFKVVWVGSQETNSQHQIGVEALESVSNFWGLEHFKSVSPTDEAAAIDRRSRSK